MVFQVFGAAWMRGRDVVDSLRAESLPGVEFHVHPYVARPQEGKAPLLEGVRLVVTDPVRFRPTLTALAMVSVLQRLYGRRRLWARPGARPGFFDKLLGTSQVREALLAGESAATIAARWRRPLAAFRAERRPWLLYPSTR